MSTRLTCTTEAGTGRRRWYFDNVELNANLFRQIGMEGVQKALMLIEDEHVRNAVANEFKQEWCFWARHDQLLPDGEWRNIIALAGRGWGKTRFGAQSVIEWKRQGYQYVNLIGATYDDAWGVMVEGESGLLAVCPPDLRPTVNQKKGLIWPDGSISRVFTAEEPERLRGKQHQKVWADELCAWRYPEAWDQMKFGLRLKSPRGASVTTPQVLVTTTPKPSKLLKELINDPQSYVIRGSTSANIANLSPEFYSDLNKKYSGTRLGRQELNAEILEDNPGALWNRTNVDSLRRYMVDEHTGKLQLPSMRRIVVAIDPAVTANEGSDETGIVVAGLGDDGHAYVLEDATSKEKISADKWAQRAIKRFYKWDADRIIAEVNNGGDLVESVIRAKDVNVSYTAVRASRGKVTRAEPVAALYEQGRVHHCGHFPELEDQMCEYNPITDKKSPDRMDALVWAITDLMLGEHNTGVLDYYETEYKKRNDKPDEVVVDGFRYKVPTLESTTVEQPQTEPEVIEPEQEPVKSKNGKLSVKEMIALSAKSVKAKPVPPVQSNLEHHRQIKNDEVRLKNMNEIEMLDFIFGPKPDPTAPEED